MLRSVVSYTLIFCLIIASFSGVSASSNNDDNSIDLAPITKAGIVSFGVVYGMFALSPYAKWKHEIKTLEEDQIFIRRHLSLIDNSRARSNALSALEVAEAQQQQTEKKFKKFTRWFYPVSAVVGIGVLMLTDRVFSDFN